MVSRSDKGDGGWRQREIEILRDAFLSWCADNHDEYLPRASEVVEAIFHFQGIMFRGRQAPSDLDSLTLLELVTEIVPSHALDDERGYIPRVGRGLALFLALQYPDNWHDLDEFIDDLDAFSKSGRVDSVVRTRETRIRRFMADLGLPPDDPGTMGMARDLLHALPREEYAQIVGLRERLPPELAWKNSTTGDMRYYGEERERILRESSPEEFLDLFDWYMPLDILDEWLRSQDGAAMALHQIRRGVLELLGVTGEVQRPTDVEDVLRHPEAIVSVPRAQASLRLLAWVHRGDRRRRPITARGSIKVADYEETAELAGISFPDKPYRPRRLVDFPQLARLWWHLSDARWIELATASTVRCTSTVLRNGVVRLALDFDELIRAGKSEKEAAQIAGARAPLLPLVMVNQAQALRCEHALEYLPILYRTMPTNVIARAVAADLALFLGAGYEFTMIPDGDDEEMDAWLDRTPYLVEGMLTIADRLVEWEKKEKFPNPWASSESLARYYARSVLKGVRIQLAILADERLFERADGKVRAYPGSRYALLTLGLGLSRRAAG
ncbi:MAG: hypothetical protein Q4P71_10105 [Actinomycetaceae bacterium]|nr:hypothetical protein [Actinomycetaceae bacterium]